MIGIYDMGNGPFRRVVRGDLFIMKRLRAMLDKTEGTFSSVESRELGEPININGFAHRVATKHGSYTVSVQW